MLLCTVPQTLWLHEIHFFFKSEKSRPCTVVPSRRQVHLRALSKVWAGDNFPHKLAKGSTQVSLWPVPKPPPGGGSGGRARCLPQAHQVCGGPAHYPSCFWGTALIIPPASGDYFKYHPQAWQRKGGEKQGWCQDTRSRVMGRIAALSFDFSCEGQGTFPSRFCLKLAGLVPGKGAPEEGRFIPTPGCSAEPRELQALPWGGKGRSCVYGLGNRKQKQWLSLCEEGSDRRGDKRLDVAEGQEKSAGE